MITTVNKEGITVLTPGKGMWLVKDGAYSNGVVYLGKMDKAENWTEQAEGPPDPVMPLPPEEELAIYKAAVAEVTKINTVTALKADLALAVEKLKTAIAIAPIGAEREIIK